MRVFQNVFAYPTYLRRLDAILSESATFTRRSNYMVGDGFNGVHLLEPVINGENGAFWTCSTDQRLQRAWGREQGLASDMDLTDVLLAQIEDARAEVFYTQAAYRFGCKFHRRLPGTVRMRVGWHSPPAPLGDVRSFDLIVNNFPRSLENYAAQGVRTAYFTPSLDPVMAEYCDNADRPIDVAFVGGYSRHHRQRAVILQAVAELGDRYRVNFALDPGKLTRLAESPLGWFPPLARHARPESIRRVSRPAVFGRAMYELFSRAKIVLNGAVDAAAQDRGNMRCFEAMGCGALLLSDAGDYPQGMQDQQTMRVYRNVQEAVNALEELLNETGQRLRIAENGLNLMRTVYSKSVQWRRFQALVG